MSLLKLACFYRSIKLEQSRYWRLDGADTGGFKSCCHTWHIQTRTLATALFKVATSLDNHSTLWILTMLHDFRHIMEEVEMFAINKSVVTAKPVGFTTSRIWRPAVRGRGPVATSEACQCGFNNGRQDLSELFKKVLYCLRLTRTATRKTGQEKFVGQPSSE